MSRYSLSSFFDDKYTNKNANLILLYVEKPRACNAFVLKSL